MKLIIPLLDDKFTSFIVSDKAGFINAYTWNKNKPYIDNCIFLMYDATIINKNTQAKVVVKLKDNHNKFTAQQLQKFLNVAQCEIIVDNNLESIQVECSNANLVRCERC